MGNDLSIRLYENGDEADIFHLTKAVHPKNGYNYNEWFDWWKWEFKKSPYGSGLVFLAEENSAIIGHLALIPIKVKHNNHIINGAIELDDMVHPNFRRKGIFSALLNYSYILAKENNIDITYIFPNDMAYPMHLKTGRHKINNTFFLFKCLNFKKLLSIYIGARYSLGFGNSISHTIDRFRRKKELYNMNNLEYFKVNSFPNSINTFLKELASENDAIVAKDDTFLNWRYTGAPNMKYDIFMVSDNGTICGYIVLRTITKDYGKAANLKIGYIVEMAALQKRPEIAEILLSGAIKHFILVNADIITAKMAINPKYLAPFKNKGFITYPQKPRLMIFSNSRNIYDIYTDKNKNILLQFGDFIDII